jgi:hypothetical protein
MVVMPPELRAAKGIVKARCFELKNKGFGRDETKALLLKTYCEPTVHAALLRVFGRLQKRRSDAGVEKGPREKKSKVFCLVPTEDLGVLAKKYQQIQFQGGLNE